ncbi:MAG: carotenoid oxygenase family protein [Halieaceae bacterium]|jgi:all-trans-8'-apo-beta-carotenal 15,15'-oxygenase|nr:carotenoid oxygenase family protein [Halieaceae bacterium]
MSPAAENSVEQSTVAPIDFHSGFLGLEQEYSGWVDNIRGRIPPDLTGTFFRNGPGTMQMGERRYGHWFDGPGMISAVSFTGGRAHFRNRYVRTTKYVEEKKSEKILFRGFGTQLEGGFRANFMRPMSNPANTSITWHGDKLCAFYEAGQPYRLDPATLETLGVELYDGALNSVKNMSAHGKINYRTGRHINFGVNVVGLGLRGLKFGLDLYDIDPRGRVAATCRIPLKEFPFVHDFGVTEHYAVFLLSSITMGVAGPILGTAAVSDVTEYRMNKPVKGIIVDLRDMKVARTFELPPALIAHFGNSFEQGDEIVTDFIRSTDPGNFAAIKDVFSLERMLGAPLCRYRINVRTGEIRHEEYFHAPGGEFPSWDMQQTCYPSRYAYYVAPVDNGTPYFYNSVVKLDTETGDFRIGNYGQHRYTSEALFVPRQDAKSEDDGYLLSFVYDAATHRTEIVILDALEPDSEIAAVKLSHHVPFGFHGHFTDRVFI